MKSNRASCGAPSARYATILAILAAAVYLTAGYPVALAAEPEGVDPWRQHLPQSAEEAVRWAARGIHQPALHLLGGNEQRAKGITTALNVVVILVDFVDFPADRDAHPPQYYEELLFSRGTRPGGSVADFLLASSHGRLLLGGEVRGWFTMPSSKDYYTSLGGGLGTYPANSQGLAVQAIGVADYTINFADFDNEGPDGVPDSGDDDELIDGVLLVHAGSGGEGRHPSEFTSVHWLIPSPYGPLPVDGVFARYFTVNPEDGKIGIFLHELGHLLGLPDLYDTDGGSFGLGAWSLMSGGIALGEEGLPVDFDAWCKTKLGFVDVARLFSNQDGVAIAPIQTSGKVYRLWSEGLGTDEYFLVENRPPTGIDANLPAGGLLVYHVDDRVPNNVNPNRYRVALEQADGLFQLENRFQDSSFGDDGDPFRGGDLFSRYSTPSSRSYDGTDTYVAIFDIDGPQPDGTITASMHVQASAVVEVTDVTMVELEGNNDGLVSAGELAGVIPTIRVSRLPAFDLDLHVDALDPRGEVLDPEHEIGTIPLGHEYTLAEPIRVRIASALPSDPFGLPLEFRLEWQDAPTRRVEVELGVGTLVGREDDFESSADGWVAGPVRPTALSQWFRAPGFGTENSVGFRYGNGFSGYRIGGDAALTSPPVLLPPGAELVWDQRVDIGLPDSTRILVGGVVELSVNGGDWQLAVPDAGYPLFYGGQNPERIGMPVYAGTVADGLFHSARINLSEYTGSLRVRFRFFSEVSSALGAGWWIDNVRIRTGPTPVRVLATEALVEGSDVTLSWKLAEPLPARVRWRRGFDPGTAVSVADGWMPAASEGTLRDPGAGASLPARYWLEGLERDGSIERWGPLDVQAPTAAVPAWRVLNNPARGPVHLAWEMPLPAEAVLEVYDVQGRLVAEMALPSAPGSAVWNGRGLDGRPTAPGIYFARIRNVPVAPVRVVRLP